MYISECSYHEHIIHNYRKEGREEVSRWEENKFMMRGMVDGATVEAIEGDNNLRQREWQ